MPRYSFRDPPTPLVSLEAVLDGDPLHTPPNEVGNLSAGLTGNEHDATPPHERKFDNGNKHWVATMAPGNYEIDDAPEEGGLMHVHRISDDGERELMLALPAGDYTAEDDEAGTHIFRVPEDENARSILNGKTSDASIPNRRVAEMTTLARLNRFHRARAWDRSPTTTRSPLATDPTLRAINARNRKLYGGDDAA